jgi:hypothetical protein
MKLLQRCSGVTDDIGLTPHVVILRSEATKDPRRRSEWLACPAGILRFAQDDEEGAQAAGVVARDDEG